MATTTDTQAQNGALEQELAELHREEHELAERTTSFQSFLIAGSVTAFVAIVVAIAALVVALSNKSDNTTIVSRTVTAAPTNAKPALTALPSTVGVGLKEFKVLPNSTQAKAGRVTFNVSNNGSITHEFVVVRTNSPAGSIPLDKGRASETGNVGETGDLLPGQAKSVTINLKAGHYALICNLPGHYVAGQHTDFTVK